MILDGAETAIACCEIKAEHVARAQLWRNGLHHLELDVTLQYRAKSSAIKKELGEQQAELNVAKAIAHLFTYMLAMEVRYGFLPNGTSFVIFYFVDDDPDTLFYHTAEPKDADSPDGEFQEHLSAVGLVLDFIEALWGKWAMSAEASESYKRSADSGRPKRKLRIACCLDRLRRRGGRP